MKKFILTKNMLDLLYGLQKNFPSKGFKQLTSLDVKEIRLGKKYAYVTSPSSYEGVKKLAFTLTKSFFSYIPISVSATAFRTDCSYLEFIEPHRKNYYFTRVDLKDFFHSITSDNIKCNLMDYFSDENISGEINQTHVDAIFNFVTLKIDENSKNVKFHGKSILPIGFPLSPVISNIVFRKVDIIIERMCFENNITYTRYADDLLFSTRAASRLNNPFFDTLSEKTSFIHSDKFINEISHIISVDGYKLNAKKTIKAVDTLSLNGYTISGTNDPDVKGFIRISNKKTAIIEKLLHELNKENSSDPFVFIKLYKNHLPTLNFSKGKNKFIEKFCTTQINNKLSGYRSYLISIMKFNNKYDCVNADAIQKYKVLINKLDRMINKRIS